MWGLEDLWHDRGQPKITCSLGYYPGKNVTFIWEIERNGEVITHPGCTEPPTHDHKGSTKYFSALKYIPSTGDIQSILRCIVRVDDEIYKNCEAKDEELIPSYGTCIGAMILFFCLYI